MDELLKKVNEKINSVLSSGGDIHDLKGDRASVVGIQGIIEEENLSGASLGELDDELRFLVLTLMVRFNY